ncbi:MAG: hypothetical protein VZR36_11850 [Prevotella sp.]|nr:hypothetical protein [Prevotella sp.]
MEGKEKIELTGKTDDLLFVNNQGNVKSTRLVMLDENTSIEDSEVIDVSMTSVSNNGKHPLFDSFLGKEIKITVETI